MAPVHMLVCMYVCYVQLDATHSDMYQSNPIKIEFYSSVVYHFHYFYLFFSAARAEIINNINTSLHALSYHPNNIFIYYVSLCIFVYTINITET